VQQGFDRGLGTEKYLHTGGWIPFYEDFALARLGDLDVIRTSVWLVAGRNAEKPVDEKGLSKLLKDRQRPEGYQPLANRKAEGLRALILPDGSWVPHDLRRTAATMLQGLGVPPAVIEKALNHTEPRRLVAVYQRHDYRPERREAFNRLGEHLEWLVTDQGARVIALRRA
jgi:integrase